MSVTINASTSAGLIQTADTSGTVEIQSNGSTKLTVASGGVTIPTATVTTGTVTTLNAPSGVLATQNGMTGICKAWVLYNGSAQTITGSFNVSSVTYNAQADYTINFTTAMPSASYAVCATVGDTTVVHGSSGSAVCMPQTYSTGSVRIKTGYGTMTANNWNQNNIAIFSS